MVEGDQFYRRKLPHWERPDAVYFVTFRVHGSLPRQLQQQAAAEIRSVEQRCRLQKRPASEVEIQRILVMEEYLDRDATDQYLADPKLAELVRDALLFHHERMYVLFAWCIMPNHVHLLLQPQAVTGDGGVPSLAKILHSLKSFTAHQASRAGLVSGHLWQREYFDRRVRNDAELARYQEYILQNPVKAGLVQCAADYPWAGTPPSRR